MVNDQPFWIKGVGCNAATGPRGEDYLLMAKDMGANAVHTWGMAPRSYLDKAHSYGLKVNVGVWLNPIRGQKNESYLDFSYRERLRQKIMEYVHQMKDHPALLFWTVGNEVFTFTEADEEKEAFGAFLKELLHLIHEEDPDHPVTYASAGTQDLVYLKKYLPSLDFVGINTYGEFSSIQQSLEKNGYEKPFYLNEYGPTGSWELAHDENDMPWDPLDPIKAGNYESLWKQVENRRSECLGGFAFVLGPMRNQDSLTWFNINYGDLKREAYWKLFSLYTGKKSSHRCPRIRQFKVDRVSGIHPGERINVQVDASDSNSPITYNYFITNVCDDPLIVEEPVFYPTDPQIKTPGTARLKVPLKPGIYRVYVCVADNHKNAAIADRSIQVVPR